MLVALLLGTDKNSGVSSRILEDFERYFENDWSFHGIELEGDKIWRWGLDVWIEENILHVVMFFSSHRVKNWVFY
jgi:hypothetical protein